MNTHFLVKTNKSPLEYSCGESIKFTFTLVKGDNPADVKFLKYKYESEDGCTSAGVLHGKTGTFEFSASTSTAGLVRIIAHPVDESGNAIEGVDSIFAGAFADIDNIVPLAEKPEGYDEFWDKQVRELESVEPTVLEKNKLDLPDYPNYDIYDMKIACAGNAPVSGILTMPKSIPEGGLPVRVGYKGYGVVSAPIEPIENTIVFFTNAHGFKNLQPESYYKTLEENELNRYGFSDEENASPDTCYFKNMFIRAAQALRFAATIPEGNSIHVWGGSQGAAQALSGLALSGIPTEAEIFVPWMCDIHAFKKRRIKGSPPSQKAMQFYDLINMASRIKDKNISIDVRAGFGDDVCPASGVLSLYKAIPTKKKITFVQNKSHSYEAEDADKFEIIG